MTDEFPVEWLDPSDAEITWEWDDMHMPAALSALAGDYVRLIGAGMAYGHRGSATPVEIRDPNLERICLFRARDGCPGVGTSRDVGARGPSAPEHAIPLTEAYWRDGRSPSSARPMPGSPSVRSRPCRPRIWPTPWDEVWSADRSLLVDPFLRHPRAVPGPRGPRRPVRVRHREAAPGEALGLDRWRRSTNSTTSSAGLEDLAALVAADAGARRAPGRARRHRRRPGSVPGRRSIRAALEAFLTEHGHLGQSFDDLTLASWARGARPPAGRARQARGAPGRGRRGGTASSARGQGGRARRSCAGGPRRRSGDGWSASRSSSTDARADRAA